jgi:hypothetical protein
LRRTFQTDVQLSDYGQIKSGFLSLQSTGNSLPTLNSKSSTDDISLDKNGSLSL